MTLHILFIRLHTSRTASGFKPDMNTLDNSKKNQDNRTTHSEKWDRPRVNVQSLQNISDNSEVNYRWYLIYFHI